MPWANRSTSRKAASSVSYGRKRVPPSEGPNTVEWTATMARRPVAGSAVNDTSSAPAALARSNTSELIEPDTSQRYRGSPVCDRLRSSAIIGSRAARSRHLRLLEHAHVRGGWPPQGAPAGGLDRHSRGRRLRRRTSAARRRLRGLVERLRGRVEGEPAVPGGRGGGGDPRGARVRAPPGLRDELLAAFREA